MLTLLWCVAALLATAVLAIPASTRPGGHFAVYGISLLAAATALVAAATVLLNGSATPAEAMLPLGLPWLGAHFSIDALAAFFLVVVNLGAGAASLYGMGYGGHEEAPGRVLPFYPAFLAGMNMVVLADDAFTFLLSWEFMSLSSWALVMAHHRGAGNARAGYVYLIMAGFGTMALLLGFGLLSGPAGGYGFASIREATLSPGVGALVFVLILLGAGSKAGIVPLHVWLPLAHPAAPTHVSALMSGVMTKVALYGFIRIVFDLLDQPSWQSAMTILVLGGVTAVLGILSAMLQGDMKRLLAYSSVENIGVVFVGLGLAIAFRFNGMNVAAALAMTAALFHILNHMLFKSLLFFGAGAVLTATGERDMEKLGGLIHRMPVTSVAFLVGCVAISALPPLNGFVSEWLTFQSVLQSPQFPQWGLKVVVPAVGGLLALSAALAGACFVKAFGVAFLGRARSAAAAEAREVDIFSRSAMAGLAALCLLAGILPGFVIDALSPVTQLLTGTRIPAQASQAWLSIIPITEGRSSYNGMLVFLFVVASALLAAGAIHRLATRDLRRGPPWGCGFPDPAPLAQYTGGSFAQPIRRVFGTLAFRAREQVDMPPPGDSRPATFHISLRDPVWDVLYAPIATYVSAVGGKLSRLQFLTIRLYLSLVLTLLVALLTVLAIWH
jgi:hydrogenase-4 component B